VKDLLKAQAALKLIDKQLKHQLDKIL